MTKRKRNPSIISDPKVGIIFNLPTKPTIGEEIDYVSEAEIEEQLKDIKEALNKLDLEYRSFSLKNEIGSLIKALKKYKPDVVINLCEAAFGKSYLEMNVPAMLELLKIPYTGAPPLSLALCSNKGLAKDILRARGIPTPKYQVLNSFKDWEGGIDYPLFVKPSQENASLGISKESFVRNNSALEKRVNYITRRYRQPALVEKYISGRELNVAILGNKRPKVLPISEIIFEFSKEPNIVDYSAKWLKNSEEYKKTVPVCPAKLSTSVKNKVERIALQTYETLRCRDYARVDMRLKNGTPYVLEANPNPDISITAGFVRSLKAIGMSFESFVEEILYYALERSSKQFY